MRSTRRSGSSAPRASACSSCTQWAKDVPGEVLAELVNQGRARLARLHPRRREGAQGWIVSYLPEVGYLRPVAELLTSLGIGEAVVTVMSETGAPTPGRVDPAAGAPQSLMGPIGTDAITAAAKSSSLQDTYGQTVRKTNREPVGAARPRGDRQDKSPPSPAIRRCRWTPISRRCRRRPSLRAPAWWRKC